MSSTLSLPPSHLISQGAEARLYGVTFLGRECVVKERFQKKYRHPALDAEIATQRTTRESRLLARCRKVGIRTPTVYHVDMRTRRIFMERIDGITMKDFITHNRANPDALRRAAKQLGELIAALHNHDIIHGDLTTSNVLIEKSSLTADKLSMVAIDFGLGDVAALDEDKAVDLYVLSRAISSAHPAHDELLFNAFSAQYRVSANDGARILTHYDSVQQRGRKKIAFG